MRNSLLLELCEAHLDIFCFTLINYLVNTVPSQNESKKFSSFLAQSRVNEHGDAHCMQAMASQGLLELSLHELVFQIVWDIRSESLHRAYKYSNNPIIKVCKEVQPSARQSHLTSQRTNHLLL